MHSCVASLHSRLTTLYLLLFVYICIYLLIENLGLLRMGANLAVSLFQTYELLISVQNTSHGYMAVSLILNHGFS